MNQLNVLCYNYDEKYFSRYKFKEKNYKANSEEILDDDVKCIPQQPLPLSFDDINPFG